MKSITEMSLQEIAECKEKFGQIFVAVVFNHANNQLSDYEEFYKEILDKRIENLPKRFSVQRRFTRAINKPLDWQKINEQNGYSFWQAIERETMRRVYQVTNGEKPINDAGYYELNHLYKIKGLTKVSFDRLPNNLLDTF